MFRYRIIMEGEVKAHPNSAIHAFMAPNRTTADKDAKAWARRRKAIKLTRLKD